MSNTLLCALIGAAHADGVGRIAPGRLDVDGPQGRGTAALQLSADWNQPHPEIRRAVIIVHGKLRNAVTYFDGGRQAARAAGAAGDTLLIAPQFLATSDVARHGLSDTLLRWTPRGWMSGLPAQGPAPISSFAVFDAILARLADRARLPNLREVVIAGHSGGGQVVQRYAVLGQGGQALADAGIALRYVVANPSSYAYFSADRPRPVDAQACPGFDTWKYGMRDLPPYAGQADAAALERRYAQRDVTYLLGEQDTDPRHPALDKGCEAEAQGAWRLARGQAYYRYLRARHPDGLAQRVVTVPGVGHDGKRMFGSPQGQAALFGPPAR
ncbi:alpha/beta hydrolase [Bordetella genomosp. 13]|uniref:alpha/beta hydrolase n=1 Tax=Bordetella genomosp. 13 TaxID=463040 RepID=UPI0021B5C416|nr:alpha/beta hydrolase [Bordetella genomosp. 13]